MIVALSFLLQNAMSRFNMVQVYSLGYSYIIFVTPSYIVRISFEYSSNRSEDDKGLLWVNLYLVNYHIRRFIDNGIGNKAISCSIMRWPWDHGSSRM